MTQTHPTAEVAALVPTGKKKKKNLSAALSSSGPIRFSPKTVLIHQRRKEFSFRLDHESDFTRVDSRWQQTGEVGRAWRARGLGGGFQVSC